MARTRSLKPDFFKDLLLAELPLSVRYLYAGMWCQMDKGGVCEADPRLLKIEIFPFDETITAGTVESWCEMLQAKGRLQKCSFEGKQYFRCPTFERHQRFHRDEKEKFLIPKHLWNDALHDTLRPGADPVPAPLRPGAKSPVICNLESVIGIPQGGVTPPPHEELEIIPQPQLSSLSLSLEKFYLERRGMLARRLPPKERAALDEICHIANDPKAAIEHYLADGREYYTKRKWPLSVLLENIGEHTSTNTAPPPKKHPIVQQNEDRAAAYAEMPRDPEAAKRLREIMEKIG